MTICIGKTVLTASKHFEEDRKTRLEIIGNNIGFGTAVLASCVQDTPKGKREYLLTDSGIMIIKPIDKDILITAYVPNVTQCQQIYSKSKSRMVMPYWVVRMVQINQEYFL